jgi:FkbM family methyltransferase
VPQSQSRLRQIFSRLVTNFALDYQFATFRAWPLAWQARWGYLPQKYLAILRNQRGITFLGRSFRYDNRLMPALLEGYPTEVAEMDSYVHFATATEILDVGANVGQFGFVLKTFFPHLEIVSFEPNPKAFALLASNAAQFSGWRCFPFGLARTTQSRDFFVVEGKSAQGSVFAENASVNLLRPDVTQLQVQLEYLSDAALAAHALPRDYDFVKIDVEGFETDVLASLDRIRWRFMYLEVSLARQGRTTLEEVTRLIEQTWGARPRIVHQQHSGDAADVLHVILAAGT